MLHTYAAALPDALNCSARDVILPVVPMFHVNAWGLPYIACMVGAKLVFPGPALDGKSLYELLEAEQVTLLAFRLSGKACLVMLRKPASDSRA
ncbi:long-chain-fatty-acid--CoA ligase [Caballeronia choica]|uniref:Long-chain-fatty-acid--CoA ligase n=1 Tax=Caballeronia choica TaxID=326476 RepID=A0A158KVI3_9BURK|nr:long-chain-fatty-acid--CoA ligase [Caballeronia choica]